MLACPRREQQAAVSHRDAADLSCATWKREPLGAAPTAVVGWELEAGRAASFLNLLQLLHLCTF